eukprot:gene23710-biopygen5850
MGPEVGPAFQRLSRGTTMASLSVRFHFLEIALENSSWNISFAPRCEPPRARAPGPQMIWMESGSSLAFHRLSRDSIYAILSVRLAKFRSQLENGTDLVTDSRGVPDDVRASLHPLATTRGAQAVPSRHRRRGPFEAGPAPAPAPIGRTRYRPPPAGLVPLLAAAGALRRDAADVRDGDGEEGGARRGRRGRRRSALSARAVLAEGQMVPQRRGAIWYGLPVFSGMRWLCCAGVAVII